MSLHDAVKNRVSCMITDRRCYTRRTKSSWLKTTCKSWRRWTRLTLSSGASSMTNDDGYLYSLCDYKDIKLVGKRRGCGHFECLKMYCFIFPAFVKFWWCFLCGSEGKLWYRLKRSAKLFCLRLGVGVFSLRGFRFPLSSLIFAFSYDLALR